jgi:hypothetical protein
MIEHLCWVSINLGSLIRRWPIKSSSDYNGILFTLSVTCLTATMFDHLIFSVSCFVLSSNSSCLELLSTLLAENTVLLSQLECCLAHRTENLPLYEAITQKRLPCSSFFIGPYLEQGVCVRIILRTCYEINVTSLMKAELESKIRKTPQCIRPLKVAIHVMASNLGPWLPTVFPR